MKLPFPLTQHFSYRNVPKKSPWKNATATLTKPYDVLRKECSYKSFAELMRCMEEKLYIQRDEIELTGTLASDLPGKNTTWDLKYRGGAFGTCHTFHYPFPTGTNPEKDAVDIKFSEKLSFNVYIHDPDFFMPTSNPSTFPRFALTFNEKEKVFKTFYIEVIINLPFR